MEKAPPPEPLKSTPPLCLRLGPQLGRIQAAAEAPGLRIQKVPPAALSEFVIKTKAHLCFGSFKGVTSGAGMPRG